MPTDRLKELRYEPVVKVLPTDPPVTSELVGSATPAIQFFDSTSPLLTQELQDEVNQLRGLIERLKRTVQGMEKHLEQRQWYIEDTQGSTNLSNVKASTSSDVDVSLFVTENNQLSSEIRKRIKGLQMRIDQEGKDSGEKKLHQGILNALLSQFISQVEKYKKVHDNYNSKAKSRFIRTAQIVIPNATEEQIEEMIDNKQQVQTLIYDKIMADQRHAEARNALVLMEEQRRDLATLEKNISELHSLFLDVYALMNAQGDSLQHINAELQDAKPRFEKALTNLNEAEKYVKRRRRRNIAVIATITGIGLIATAAALAPLLAFA